MGAFRIHGTAPGEFLRILRETERRYAGLFGAAPACDIHFEEFPSGADSRLELVEGRPTLRLNLHVVMGYGATGLRVVIAHEVFHMLQMERLGMGGEAPPGAGELPLTLFGEGQATFATTLVVPEVPAWTAYSLHESDADACREREREIARRALDLWEDGEGEPVSALFSPAAASELPPRSGYYLGLRVGQELGAERDPVSVALLPFARYEPLARDVVATLSSTKGAADR